MATITDYGTPHMHCDPVSSRTFEDFNTYLVVLLSLHELGLYRAASPTLPEYNGPASASWQTDAILNSLKALTNRMYTAEEALASVGAPDTCENATRPDIQNRRSLSPCSESSDYVVVRRSPSMRLSNDFTCRSAESVLSDIGSLNDDEMRSLGLDCEGSTPGGRTPSSTTTCRDGVHNVDSTSSYASKFGPPTSQPEQPIYPTATTDRITAIPMSSSSFTGSKSESSPVVPIPPTTAAFDGGISADEELRLLKAQIGDIARVCKAVARGDLSQKITVPVQGVAMLQLKDVVNNMVDKLGRFANEINFAFQEVGTEGKLGGQAWVPDAEGIWCELTCVFNNLAANLTSQVRTVTEVTKAVARGDLSKQIELDACGEIMDLKNTVNSMVVRLRSLTDEVLRVTLEVGNQGKLGGQVRVRGAEGVWFELVRHVNQTCTSLTDQVRSVNDIAAAVAKGDLSQKMEISGKGEMATMKSTGVTERPTVCKKMACIFLQLLRSIGAVAKAVALGDLSRTVNVSAQGEWCDVKVTVNAMVERLRSLDNAATGVGLEVE